MALLALFVLGQGLPVAAAPKPVITVHVNGDRVEYDQEAGTLAVQGAVTITAQTDKPGMPTVSIASSQLEANLLQGRLIANEEVRVRSQQLSMRGQRIEMDFARDEFRLLGGALEVAAAMPSAPDRPVRGFFFGDEILKQADVIYLIEGRVTTCDRKNPHYSIGAGQCEFDTRTQRWTIRKGRIQVFGGKFTIPGQHTTYLGPDAPGLPHLRMPGFSDVDGFYFPLAMLMSQEKAPWQVTAGVRLGTKLRFPAELRAVRGNGEERLTLLATYRDEVLWDLRQRSYLNRLPEVTWERQFTGLGHEDSALRLNLSLANLQERDLDGAGTTNLKGEITAQYTPWATPRRTHRGAWLSVGGRQSFYEQGQTLTDLALEAGVGHQFGELTKATVWYVHHETSGDTPFRFDDIYAENELFGDLRLGLGRNWYVQAEGRLDVDDNHLREFTVGLHKRMHCLTWGLTWDQTRGEIGVAFDLNGLTGDTPPYASQPLVKPDEVPPLPDMVPALPGQEKLVLPLGAP